MPFHTVPNAPDPSLLSRRTFKSEYSMLAALNESKIVLVCFGCLTPCFGDTTTYSEIPLQLSMNVLTKVSLIVWSGLKM